MMQFAVSNHLIELDSGTWGLNDRDLAVERADQLRRKLSFLRDAVLGEAGRGTHFNRRGKLDKSPGPDGM